MTVQTAQRARFDGSRQKQRAMIGKIKVYQKQLTLDDDDYRQILFDETGQSSSTLCNEAELERVICRLEAQGAKPLPKSGKTRRAEHPMAKKARALWISLYHLGWVRSPEESALESFAKRQLKCEKLVWANQRHSSKLIEALKARAEIEGWRQTDDSGNNLDVRRLQEGLALAILAKLVAIGEVPDHWNLNQAAFRLCGIKLGEVAVSTEGYHELAAALGKKLRAAGGAA